MDDSEWKRSAWLIEDFIEAEKAKMNWFDRLVWNYPKVTATRTIAGSLKNIEFGSEKILRPSVTLKIFSLMFVLFAGIFWVVLLRLLLLYRTPYIVILVAFLFLTFLIFYLVINSFFNKRYIYTIKIDDSGITASRHLFNWADIAETCILNRQEGKRTNSYLVIFKKDKSIERLDLFKFSVSDKKLSMIIEYYKERNLRGK